MNENSLIEIKALKVSFPYENKHIQVVRGVDLKIKSNEIIGVLGESGSGKTVTVSAILGLTKFDNGSIDSGEIFYNNSDILKMDEKAMRKIRGREISYIFQNPVETLNPYRRIGKQMEEVQKVHGEKVQKERILKLLEDVGLDNGDVIYGMYPSQLSGGQCQRISIAMSLIGSPRLIIADEPTSSIDASMQGIILELFEKINMKYGVSIAIITHNFEIVKKFCNRVIVMYGGLVMEQGSVMEVLSNPIHPYTKELISCAKSMSENNKTLYTLEGKTPSPTELKNDCPFHNRCKLCSAECLEGIPEMKTFEDGREARCLKL